MNNDPKYPRFDDEEEQEAKDKRSSEWWKEMDEESDSSDDGSLDIEPEENWIGELRKVGLKPKERPRD